MSMLEQKGEDQLAVLIANAGLVDPESLRQAMSDAKRLRIHLDRALIMSGQTTDAALATVYNARDLVASGKVTLNAAINALRVAKQENISFNDALTRLKGLHRPTQTVFTLTNELTSLMLEAGIITSEQLGQAIVLATKTAMLTGRVLRINKHVSTELLASCIEGVLMLREKTQTEVQVLAGLKHAKEKNVTLAQAMFELGTYKQPDNYSLRLADLLIMSELLSYDDFLECWELTIVKMKAFEQVVVEQGLITTGGISVANHMLGLVASESLRPFQAAEVLKKIEDAGITVPEAVAEAVAKGARSGVGKPLRIGDLLVAATLTSQEQLDSVLNAETAQSSSSIKTGKILLKAGLLNEATLFRALRVQSLWRYGYISRSSAVEALRRCEVERENLEVTFTKMNLYCPSAMQWSWI